MLPGDMIFLVWMGGLILAYMLGSHEGRVNLLKDLIAKKPTRVGNMLVHADTVVTREEDES